MKLDRRRLLAGIGSIPLAGFAARALAGEPVTVFEGNFVTMEPSLPEARFVAVSGGMILGLADTREALAPWTSGRETRVDRSFAGKTVFPGLIDPHIHPMQSAVMLNVPFIAPDDWVLPRGTYPGVRTPAGYRERLRALLASDASRPLITWGYHELFHGALDRKALDELAPDRPLVVWQRSFHEVIVNSAMLRDWGLADEAAFNAALAGIKADPAHFSFAKGMFSETALPLALAKLRPVILAPEKLRAGMADLRTLLLRHGVTATADMATGIFAGFDVESGLIRSAFEAPDCAARIDLVPMAMELDKVADLDAWYAAARGKVEGAHVHLPRRVKLFADGAYFAQNMQMGPPGYTDGHMGKWITEPADLDRQVRRYWDAGFSLHIHVNGDEGLDVLLDALEPVVTGPRHARQTATLEHLGYSTEAQNRRIARLGLFVSGQPNYLRVLGDAYAAHGLGPDRAATMDRFGSLERLGVPLGLHSDFNMAPIDPFYLAWIAANRITLEGHVLAPQERLSLGKALRAITIEAAEVIGRDDELGSLAAGKRANFAVLDRDPRAIGAAALDKVKVEAVIYEGRSFAT
ncbi:MAG: amidohydrolase family protein [Sphingomonadales bacterium]|nr:amidohydrolase family protein [Sphingomonadales bacterium]MDE2569781.1 amidohydrolase family protein [Sphingomonadales bacterium]